MKTLLTAHLFHPLPDEIMDKGRNKKGASIKTISTPLMQGFFPNKKDSLFFLMQVRKVPVQRWIDDPKQGGGSALWEYWGIQFASLATLSSLRVLPSPCG